MAEQAEDEQEEQQEAPQPGSASTAIMRDRYLIDCASPLPHLDSPTAKAYVATDRREPELDLFALVCNPDIPPRTDVMSRLKASKSRGIIPLIEWHAIEWPMTGVHTMVVILIRPKGGRLSDILAADKTRISEYDVVKRVLQPLLSALNTLAEDRITHRAIRPDNLFFMDEAYEELVVGECFTVPPGMDQPQAFETIERSMASISGRGPGTQADDVYAAGATMAMILSDRNPVLAMNSLDLLTHKFEHGSYSTICGNSRLPMTLIEALRGFLADNPENRWVAEDIEAWIDGRKRSPLQRQGDTKATTPYTFQGHAHLTPRGLAFGFSLAYEEAYRTLKSDKTLDGWFRRTLNNEELADKIATIMEKAAAAQGSISASAEVVISQICSILDPQGPIRYKDFALMPDSLGTAVAIEVLINNNNQVIAEILLRDISENWFKVQPSALAVHMTWQRNFTQCRSYLRNNATGYGMERAIYELNAGISCRSPLIIDEYVVDDAGILPALDAVANKVETDSAPMDRHISAFLASRFSEDIQPHLKALYSTAQERTIIGVLSLLALIQWKLKSDPVFGLASWVGGLLGPAINTYHNRETRRELEREIPQLVRQGSMPDLFDLIDNADRRQEDESGFDEAQNEFSLAEDEIFEVEGDEVEREKNLLRAGQKAAAMVAIMLSLTIITMYFMLDSW